MPPSRFGSVSAYRNATLTAFNATERYEELSTSSTSSCNQDVPLTCSLTHLISLNSSPGVINYFRHSNTGKHSNKSPSFNAINGKISDLKVTTYFHSTFNSQLLAVSNQSDSVNVYSLPYSNQTAEDPVRSELRQEEKPILITSFQVENAANLSWHPNAQDLLLVSSSTSNFLVIYHLEDGKKSKVAIRLEVDSPVWNADWSQDGKFIVASSKDGLVRVWNPRESQKPLVAFQAHQSKLKPTRSIFVRSSHVVTTGFGSQREREISVWDLSYLNFYPIDLPGGVGIHTGAWNPDGRYLALAGKDGNIRVVDPRDQNGKVGEVKGHSSLRPNRLLWISSSHLISVGHDKSSSRQLILYEFVSESSFSLNEISALQLDISPSILFPDFDPLTSILFLHSKGARTISSYEVRPEHSTKSKLSVKASTGGGSRFGSNQKEVWNPLPVYQGSEPQLGLAFRSRREVDVKNVEIESSLRIARGEARLVSWKISRNRPEYFQDDIYVPMLADDKPLLEGSQWFKGENGKVENGEILDLKPSNMDLLSKAPALASKSTRPKGPIQRGMEKEREDAILAGVFNNAKGVNDRKAQEDKEEGVGVTGKWGEEARSRVPDSGDWSDED